jgi:hypothetical protein
MAHAQKPEFVFRRNGRVHLNRRGTSVQSTTGSRAVRISGSNAGYTTFRGSVRVLATHSIRHFPLHFPTRASLCAIRSIKAYPVTDDDDDDGGCLLGRDTASISNRFPKIQGNVVPSSLSVKCPRSDAASVPAKGNLKLLAQN